MYPFVAFHFYICNEMSYIPDIIDYKPFYIQTDADEMAIDTTHWGMVARVNPFPILPTPKEVYRNEWLDEDGDDEYIPDELKISSYEIEVEFVYKGELNTAHTQIKGFLDYLTGRGGTGAELMVYDTYTKIGRQSVRYVNAEPDIFWRQEEGGDVVVFVVTFKVNDPTTEITLSK